ncbi:hypothetical protein O3G_MSEX004964 [Manduca sexta]|uniref:Uncharacterized protein n=1 Tax=Manduca sexta TaxID=7130 RepID=A0A921YZE7_MANSE|nr:hypothetical protein O3G_MSEX004964 [Manduca sexta]
MDTIKDTLTDMMEMFHKRMAEFDTELRKSSASTTTTSSLASDFALFRTFIMQALATLQQQVEVLARNIDNVEMRTRRKILLLHGVQEDDKEDASLVVSAIFKDRLNIADFTPKDIKRCHRMGRPTSAKKPRPILLKLHEVSVRDKLWRAKTKLRGTGFTLSEFLTKSRHDLFMAAREKFGVTKCWTQEGHIYILGPDGVRNRIVSLQDINRIGNARHEKPITPASKATSTKPKRAATRK